jgi:hypothetical protein
VSSADVLVARHVRAVCRCAIDKDRADRVEIFGLSKRDIIEYVPAEDLVGPEETWPMLKEEWHAKGGPRVLSLKDFLRVDKGLQLGAKVLRQIAQGMDQYQMSCSHSSNFAAIRVDLEH